MKANEWLQQLLEIMVDKEASDLLISVNAPPTLKMAGQLIPLGEQVLSPAQVAELVKAQIAKLQQRATHDHGAEDKRGAGAGGRSAAHAERVLARLRQKLDGFESGHLLSVKGQVKVLVNGMQSLAHALTSFVSN